jgi:hypothetical protein
VLPLTECRPLPKALRPFDHSVISPKQQCPGEECTLPTRLNELRRQSIDACQAFVSWRDAGSQSRRHPSHTGPL